MHRITKKTWLLQVVVTLISTVTTAAGVLLDLNTRGLLQDERVRVLVAAIAILSTPLGITLTWYLSAQDAQRQNDKENIKKLLYATATMISKDPDARAAIWVRGKNKELYVYEDSGFNPGLKQLRLRYEKGEGQGVVGRFFWNRKEGPTIAEDIDPNTTYNLESEQLKLVASVKSVLVAIIENQDGTERIGVLAIDSGLSKDDAGFSTTKAGGDLISIAMTVGGHLEKYKIVKLDQSESR